ncbi:hypothetical protein [Mariniphaga sediminis]|jgi:hypothetical protein|nr:hypothetical protein [Mariniphaga sediminis]
MRKRTMIWKFFTAFTLASVVLTSCVDDPEPAAVDAAPDVFVQKMVQDGEEKYALAFWVLGNKELESVTVEGPEDGSWTLDQSAENKRVFSLFPETENYKDTMPDTGDYVFTVTSTQTDEAPIDVKDELEDEELGMMVIDTTEFDNSKLNITWEKLNEADGYFVRLFDDSDDLIYMSAKVEDSKTEFSFGTSDQGWVDSSNKAQDGETYRLEVLGILYESGATANKDYNVQFISIASTEVVWGD